MPTVPQIVARLSALALLGVVLQAAAISQVEIFGVPPDVTPLLVAAVGLLMGSIAGAAFGFAAGLLVDMALLQTLGVSSLLLVAIGYGAGRLRELRDPAHGLVPMAVGAVAAATADTWASEIGALSRTPPRLVVGWRAVPPGTSGGVTVTGSLAGIAGAVLIAVAAATGVAAGWATGALPLLLVGTTLAGIAGTSADSLLGATVQAAYCCPSCAEPTERRVHRCGSPTRLVRGQPAVTNDVVNAAATLVGAATGATLAWLTG